MTTPSHLPVTAAQVGTYFVGHYYQVLQTQPDYVHQFYSDRSTLLRVDGHSRETATSMLQIHALVMSLNYTGIEIKTVHALESWDRGVLVLVSGSVHVKDFSVKRNFVQTFFLAPQEKGYFVLNDIFHFIDDQPNYHHPVAFMTQNDLVSTMNASTALREQGIVAYCVALPYTINCASSFRETILYNLRINIIYSASSYMSGSDIHARDFVQPAAVVENGTANNYGFQEQQLQAPVAESILEDSYAVQTNGSVQNSVNVLQNHMTPVEEVVEEPQKHTYASIVCISFSQAIINTFCVFPCVVVHKLTFHCFCFWKLQVAKGHSAPSAPREQSFKKSTSVSELNHVSESPAQQSAATLTEAVEDPSVVDDDAEVKSVYVKNVPSTATASDIEEEFKKFGKIRQDGVAIRTRKDLDVCYAFVEFEDITGVHNAIKASTVEIGGQQVTIEGRRANRINIYRGGRGGRGRGRGGYQNEGNGRGVRFGNRNYNNRGNGHGHDGNDYNRPRGNGYYRRQGQENRPHSNSHHVSKNGHISSD
ncbi:putative Ras GTPase-activating protein-binding protein [Helianthus annuus]|nr:putative Ras GTPase-activating protein-binding protein [Helianthus annuus]KAJ0784136.1 putative Ras GTPase-activating protein-binding protein [Helianthus annuus]